MGLLTYAVVLQNKSIPRDKPFESMTLFKMRIMEMDAGVVAQVFKAYTVNFEPSTRITVESKLHR